MNAATHLSPKQQWQTAEYGAAELRDDISDRGSTGEFSDQPKSHRHDRVYMCTADPSDRGKRHRRTHGTEEKSVNDPAQREAGHKRDKRATLRKHKNDGRQTYKQQQTSAAHLGHE